MIGGSRALWDVKRESNLILSTALQGQYIPHEGELSALTKQNHNLREVEGHSRSAIQDCGCDREGRKTKLGS